MPAPTFSARRRTAAVTALGGLAAALALTVTPADARAVAVSCGTAGATTFQPGLHLFPEPHDVSFSGTQRPCADYSGRGITAATLVADFSHVTLNCVINQKINGSGPARITWRTNGGTFTSTAVITIENSVLNNVTVSGTVTDGEFAGRHFSGRFATDLSRGVVGCPTPNGLTEAPFAGYFTIS
ncbi:hypothetical protein ABT340_33800 [Streptosporangium sp. NPDC000239]|uniref:hypothetical protein n=1 Tax=Streptosporangium sp. NPDC000239 TaxID=3154248 RepID=UPI003325BB0D